MKVLGVLGAAIGLFAALGAVITLLFGLSAIKLIVLLLGLVLFFAAVASIRSTAPPQQPTNQPLSASPPVPVKREPDVVKIRRLAKKLGVEPPEPEPKSAALNEEAARDALRAILGKRSAQ